jgi:hypothetical protein
MRGSPILRAVLVFVALLALAPMLWRLTQPADARNAAQPPMETPAKNSAVEARLTFSTPAMRAVIQHLGREVWSKAAPAGEESFTCEIPWPREGVELHAIVEWPEGTRAAAMRVRLTSPDGTEHDRSLWGDAKADDVLTFK